MSLPDALPWRLHGRAVQNQFLGQVASVQIPAMPQTPRTVTLANPICPNLLSQLPPLYRVGASCLASSRVSQHGAVGIGKYCLSACTEACLSPVAAIPENCLRCSCVCLFVETGSPATQSGRQLIKSLRMTLNGSFFCLYFLIAGDIGICHCTPFMRSWELNPVFLICQSNTLPSDLYMPHSLGQFLNTS